MGINGVECVFNGYLMLFTEGYRMIDSLVNVYIAIEHHHVEEVNQLEMRYFNSCVKLPEGT